MSLVKVAGNASGTGTITIQAPNTNTNYTLDLPAAAGTIQLSGNAISGTTGTFSGTISGGSTIGVGGATPANTGAGITFPATQSASSDANTLDDYEEGTWTPAYGFTSGSVTQDATSGRYTKIGNIVHASCRMATSALSSPSGDVFILGLPFTSAAGSNYGTAIGQASSFATAGLILRGTIEPSSATIGLLKNATNASGAYLQGSDFASGVPSNLIDLTVTYRAA